MDRTQQTGNRARIPAGKGPRHQVSMHHDRAIMGKRYGPCTLQIYSKYAHTNLRILLSFIFFFFFSILSNPKLAVAFHRACIHTHTHIYIYVFYIIPSRPRRDSAPQRAEGAPKVYTGCSQLGSIVLRTSIIMDKRTATEPPRECPEKLSFGSCPRALQV